MPAFSTRPFKRARADRPSLAAKRPFGRALADFHPLRPAERLLRDACNCGVPLRLADVRPEAATDDNVVRAEVLRFFLLGGDETAPVHEHGVQLHGAWIDGELDLRGAPVPHRVAVLETHFAERLKLQGADFGGSIELGGCSVPGLDGNEISVKGDVHLDAGFSCADGVNLVGAQIGGLLACRRARLASPRGFALLAESMNVKGAVFLDQGFEASGEVSLVEANIVGALMCGGGRFVVQGGDALSANRVVVGGGVFMTHGFWANGTVSLLYARVEGSLDCAGGVLETHEQVALCLDGISVRGSVSFNQRFRATGQVRLPGARIEGDLACTSGYFNTEAGDALVLDRAQIRGSVFLMDGFEAIGRVSLEDAGIGSELNCGASSFLVRQGHALQADRATIRGRVFLGNGFRARGEVRLVGATVGASLNCSGAQFQCTDQNAFSADGIEIRGDAVFGSARSVGEVRLVGARIGGDLNCVRARFEATGYSALNIDRAVVDGNVFLCSGFAAVGDVWLKGSHIRGDLSCVDGSFEASQHGSLIAEGLEVDGFLQFRDLREPAHGVHLTSASVRGLADDEASWGRDLILDGFHYGAIVGGAATDAPMRLRWLDKQLALHAGLDANQAGFFCPQPWRQLQIVLREMGHVEEAREVAIAFERRLRSAGRIGLAPHWGRWRAVPYRMTVRFLHRTFGALTGYGYRPIRLLVWFIAVWLFCAVAYWVVALPPYDVFAPSNPLVFQNHDYAACVPGSAEAAAEPTRPLGPHDVRVRGAGNWYLCAKLREEYSGFSPLAYSLDVILPFVDLQQENAWAPMVPTPAADPIVEFSTFTWKHATRLLVWFETLFGWIASLLLVAIVSGLAKRSDE